MSEPKTWVCGECECGPCESTVGCPEESTPPNGCHTWSGPIYAKWTELPQPNRREHLADIFQVAVLAHHQAVFEQSNIMRASPEPSRRVAYEAVDHILAARENEAADMELSPSGHGIVFNSVKDRND